MRWIVAAALLFGVVGCDGDASVDAGMPADAGPPDTGPPDAGPPDAGPMLPPPPSTLAATGLYAGEVGGPLAANVRAYTVRYPLYSDGLEKARYVLLPDGASIDTSDPDHWAFPEGTRIFKEFRLDGRLLETRLLWRAGSGPGEWVYVAYRHRADGTDADPVPDGEPDVLGTFHDVPSSADCRGCHRGGGDFVLGIGAHQLDRATFDAWVADGVLPADAPYAEVPGTDVQRAALGYLHANCGHCHNDRHPLAMHRDLRLRLPVGLARAEDAPAWWTAAGVEAQHAIDGTTVILAPGDPAASQMIARMRVRSELAMPPFGTERVDDDGVAAVEAWILAGP